MRVFSISYALFLMVVAKRPGSAEFCSIEMGCLSRELATYRDFVRYFFIKGVLLRFYSLILLPSSFCAEFTLLKADAIKCVPVRWCDLL